MAHTTKVELYNETEKIIRIINSKGKDVEIHIRKTSLACLICQANIQVEVVE